MKKQKKHETLFLILLFALILSIPLPFLLKDKHIKFKLRETPINFLNYDDLVKLSKPLELDSALNFKLQNQLTIPHIVNNSFPFQNRDFRTKRYIRLAQWNIERGFNINLIKAIFSDKNKYYYKYKRNVQDDKVLKDELDLLSSSDIISLNEADIGMPRTEYKNTVAEIANVLGYNYAFATEFIELNPIIYHQYLDKKRFLGLHGNAIISRYPIKSAKIIKLPECYKWYEAEIQNKSLLEQARRLGAKQVFHEEITKSEVRRGGRNALIADIELPNKEIITVVSTHLEDRCFPNKRLKQFEYILSSLKSIAKPIVITGDFNTTTTDSAPTSFKKEFVKRIRDPHYIARQAAIAVAPGIPLINNLVVFGLSKIVQYKDPAAPSIPVILPNQERKFFNYLKSFYFLDGEKFDTSGDRSSNGRHGLLASSNERDAKGFSSTFKFTEPRVVAYFKLDWFFVKPKKNRFNPFNGQTLHLVNNAYFGRVSDHDPITVDISL